MSPEEAQAHPITRDIETWKNETRNLKQSVESLWKDKETKYEVWMGEKVRHYAPGYLDSPLVLVPKHRN